MFDFNKTDHEIRKNHNLCSSFKVFFQIDFVKFLQKRKMVYQFLIKLHDYPALKMHYPFYSTSVNSLINLLITLQSPKFGIIHRCICDILINYLPPCKRTSQ